MTEQTIEVGKPYPCSFAGCGKPTAYQPHADGGPGEGWRHVDPADDVATHVGYPMPRDVPEPIDVDSVFADARRQQRALSDLEATGQLAVRLSIATVEALARQIIPDYDPDRDVGEYGTFLLGMPVELDDTVPIGATVVEPRITRPGVYPQITFAQYLADPVVGGSLSSSGARTLLDKTPAHFDHYRRNGRPRASADQDFGSVAHDLVLGKGKGYVEVKAKAWRTNAAKDARAAAEEAGWVALLSKDVATVEAMAAALRTHPLAGAILDPARGEPEVTIVWRDPVTGVWCRALVDFLWHPVDAEYVYRVPDYKTAESAKPADVGRQMDRLGYHIQGFWYEQAVKSVGLAQPDQEVRFSLISQEKEPPYLVSVCSPDRDSMVLAGRRMREALELYAECTAAGEWPGYGDTAHVIELPPWATRELRGEVSW